ncbi:2-amino-4-hydroxy-6-hydroxymethyldihydropteridine diphosphokinase [Vibrio algicola]|uniref:2-amino-4-hydroxy-6-hydroxymethyldihydropteridine diphosphokinase n=1 Tax=Vibrio algicola TaxID=2662262 RepID=A0A5Q0TKN1_9VIBR|nr:2-amino-4-hydroxy-6-hydroxymethyldihydropteridine diphosphokinase [Vibrio algicola]
MTLAYIGVGSNLERHQHIQASYQELLKVSNHLRCSAVYECQPVGFDSHAFYNLVIEIETSLSLLELQQRLKQIELKWGRAKDAQKLQDRTLDLDILLFGEQVSIDNPVLPRSDIFNYEFVLKPLYQLNPYLVLPDDCRTVAKVWQQFEKKGSLTVVEFKFTP